jgi:hypothetical protein
MVGELRRGERLALGRRIDRERNGRAQGPVNKKALARCKSLAETP